MKYTLKLGAMIGSVAFFVPMSAFAAGLSFSPDTISVQAGKTFSVAVVANPGSAAMYSVRANVSFDPSVLQASGFTYTDKWIPLSQPGYDALDNSAGVVIKSGGYPGGFSSSITLGRITFKALKSGSTMITAMGDSLVLDSESKNQVSGPQGSAAVSISAITATKTTESTKATKTATPTVKSSPSLVAATSTVSTVPQRSLLASVDNAITLGTGSPLVSALLAALVVLGIICTTSFLRKRIV